ncbi:translocation and assembly module lipoprotein TamL [Algoriphagus machipongonensis]|uniref:Outer membrane protein n=1 Tax=Algoriphagus machipongonensis TaxID=388413 RepID=A3I1U4_9BACT|nr:BamA/TamA family outer membrane protein [Algoriphagus machipongonensis]EAZ79760.1 outer membrane protein [Algoriphagus machipongonensis]
MKFTKYILFICALIALAACSVTKRIPDGKFLLYENELEGVEQTNKDDLNPLIIQEPNTIIPVFDYSLGVNIYRLGQSFYDSAKVDAKLDEKREELQLISQRRSENPDDGKLIKKQEKLETKVENLEKKQEFGNFLMRTGNPATILDSSKTVLSTTEMSNYLFNKGYMDAKVEYEVRTKKKKAFVTYKVIENQPYTIDSVYVRSENEEILKLINSSNSELQVNTNYDQDKIVAERNRLEDLLKNNGFFMFSKSFIEYNVFQDTSKKTVVIEELIRKPTFTDIHEVYTIDSIYFRVNPGANIFEDEKVSKQYRDIDFSFYRDRFSEKILSSRVFLNKGERYNRSKVLQSQRQLNNLDLFRFVNISFDTLNTSLTAKIITQPNQKYQLTNQLGLSITEQLPGPFFSASLRNRNFFRAGEILEFNFRAGLEGVASATDQGVYQSKELGTSASVIFPRFLIPFFPKSLEKYGKYNPNTRTLIGYNYTNRPEYTRSGLNGLISYTWATTSNRQQFTLNLADINYIRTPKITDEFFDVLVDLVEQGNNLIWSFLPSIVSSISGQTIINFNRYGEFATNSASLLKLFAESGGTTLNFLNVEDNNDETDLGRFQWLKFQADFRKYIPIDNKQTIAYRLNFGIAQPYGVSNGILPYEKYFFAGGGTSIRAWQARRLGPGSYTPPLTESGYFDYRFEQPAEMLFETMLEYRRKLVGYFDMALFIDAGNSWNIGVEPSRPGSDFRYDRFYKEIAVGTGIGLRMDFDFLIIRLDMATKAIDPARPEGERWILDNISFKRPLGEKGQTVFNFGIGYPF